MEVIFFALYFLVHLSLFFLGPAIIQKKLIKVSRKRKIDNVIKDYSIYVGLTILYIILYVIMYNTFNDGIKYITSRGLTNIFSNNVFILGLVAVFYMLISFIYIVYTYILSSKFFQYKKNNEAYVIIGITALFSILSYYSFYTILGLSSYSFNNIILDTIYQFDYELSTYLYFVIVLIRFAISFIKE
jgi:hypothetical protein